ncbi:MAG: hypothetical protein ACE5HX_18410 [bacterium]
MPSQKGPQQDKETLAAIWPVYRRYQALKRYPPLLASDEDSGSAEVSVYNQGST